MERGVEENSISTITVSSQPCYCKDKVTGLIKLSILHHAKGILSHEIFITFVTVIRKPLFNAEIKYILHELKARRRH